MPSHRQLTVIFFCDIEGYSALMQASEKQALAILDHYKQVLREETEQYGGTIIKNYGDGSLCLFNSAIEAVGCAIQIQKSLQVAPIVSLRIGLHIGDIVHNEDDVYGDGINVASRLEQICKPGGVVYSKYIFNEIKNHNEFKSIPLGPFSFKNIKEDVDVFALNVEGIHVPRPADFKQSRVKSIKKRRILRFSLVILALTIAFISAFTVFKSGNDYFTERGWVLLMPLENKTDEPNLSGSLDNVIKSGIQQSGYINILPQTRIRESLQRMGKSANDSLDIELAREIAIREGAHVIVKGYIEKIADSYLLTAQVIDPETELDLYRTTVRSKSSSDILNATDQLVNELRKGLGESLMSRFQNSKSLPAATTFSLEALKYLHDGQNYFNVGQYDEAIAVYKKALELDSNFVWVRVSMGMYYYYIGDKPTGEHHFKNAELNLDRVTDKEKLWFTTLISSSRGDVNKTNVTLKEYVLTFPDDGTAWYNLGINFRNLHEYDVAINAFQEALRIYPNGVNSMINIATIYNQLNQFENSYEFYNRAFEIIPYYRAWANLNHEFGFLLVKMDSIESARVNFKLMFQGGDKRKAANGHRSLALLDMYQGKLNSAIDHLQESINYRSITNNGLSIARDRMFLASAYIMQRSFAKANEQLAEIDKISQSTYLATVWLKYWGDLCLQSDKFDKAKEINGLLESRVYPQNDIDKANHLLLSGNLLIVSDSVEEGIVMLESAVRLDENNYNKGHLANAYFKSDRRSEKAENLFKEIIESKAIGWEGQEIYLTSHLRLAEIYESRGQTEEAIKYYRMFLTLWKNADKDLPLLHEVETKMEQFNIPVL